MSETDKIKVLLVDDETELLEIYQSCLEDAQEFEVTVASDVSEAFFSSRNVPFDVICTDFRMRGMNGRDLIDLLRSHRPNEGTPVIVHSGFAQEAQDACRDLPNLHFLFKPASVQELMKLIRNVAARGAGGEASPAMGPRIEEIFEKAVRKTMSDVCGLKKLEALSARAEDTETRAQLLCEMAMATDAGMITFCLGFDRASFDRISAPLVEIKHGAPEALRRETLGEIANVVFVLISRQLQDRKLVVRRVQPMFFEGESIRVEGFPGNFTHHRVFRDENLSFWTCVSYT